METLPDHAEFDDTREAYIEISRDTVEKIAQNLFIIFSKSQISIPDWISCLTDYLSEHFMNNFTPQDVLNYIINKIIKGDHGIDLDSWTYDAQQSKIREVAEWLCAEKICENIFKYEDDIKKGLDEGRYQEIHSIEEVNVIRDNEIFYGKRKSKLTKNQEEEIKRYIQENYVIKISEMLGYGTRVNVFELKPKQIPMPIPKRDKRLMLKTPNRFLVIRVLRDNYKESLGNKVNASELDAIKTFIKAKTLLTFETVNDEYTSVQDEKEDNSFIPPLIIIKAKLSHEKDPEYITIQKKIQPRGTISRLDMNFKADVHDSDNFRNKLRQFVLACKKFYKKEERIPDTVGRGNVLYTRENDVFSIYLVDINNMAPVPDCRLLSLVLLLKEIENGLKSEYFEDIKADLKSEYFKTAREILKILGASEKYQHFDLRAIQTIVETVYLNPDNSLVHDFLSKTRMIDDKDEPIFMHNLDNLLRLENAICETELEKGLITDEEYKEKILLIKEEDIYKIFITSRGEWVNQRSTGLHDILKNKNEGHDNWISYFMTNLYSIILQKNGTI
ncbi:hypothetical protein JW911_00120 [Candidatus Peregrinibacteria bacterium]|nr:hypothetical protein [Candidatus Peregrinibacteria bacterium]